MNEYRTKDGRFLELMMLGDNDRDWVDLCKHLDRPELASDQRFSSSADRQSHCAEGVEALDQIFAERTLGEWKTALATTTGVWAPVQTPEEAFEDPQTVANGFLRSVDYPTGPLRLPSPPILFDEDPGDPPRAPDYGEHTDVILESLGFDGPAIEKLRSEGVVG
jgi:crotonobetainyl-CoA:carnitine CoA-transferase CaiB-like acyl-CoA transferase